MKKIIKELLKPFLCTLGCYYFLNVIAFSTGKPLTLIGSVIMISFSVVLTSWILKEGSE